MRSSVEHNGYDTYRRRKVSEQPVHLLNLRLRVQGGGFDHRSGTMTRVDR